MKNLNVNEIQEVNGGFLDEVGYLEDAMVIGGGVLAGLGSAAITAPAIVVIGGVAGAYYGGKWLGGLINSAMKAN